MTIQKSILSTLFFFLFIQVTAIWVVLNRFLDIQFLVDDYNYFVSGVIEIIGIIIFFFIIKNQKALIPKRTSIIYYLLAIICAIVYVYSQRWLNLIYDLFASTDFANQITYEFSFAAIDNFTFNSLAIIVLSPISEEFFFRCFIQKGLQKEYKPLIFIGISAILFAMLHLPNTYISFVVFFGGIISATLYYKSKSITPSIVFHIIWNLLINFS